MNNQRYKVVHVVESFATGVYDIIVSLANGIPEADHVVAYWRRQETPDCPEKDFPANVSLVELAHSDGRFGLTRELLGTWQAYRFLRTTSTDAVIHLHSTKAGIWGRIALAILRRRRQVVYTPHAAAFLRLDIGKMLPKIVAFMEWFLSAVVKTRIVCCSPSEAGEYRRRHMSAEYVWNGIPASQLSRSRTRSENHVVVAGMGRISPQKGASFFGEIASVLADRNVRFRWIGDGPERGVLPASVDVTGWVSRDDALNALNDVDIFLSTSEWEGLSMAVLQALDSGIPVLLRMCVGNVDVAGLLPSSPVFSTREECVEKLLALAASPSRLEAEGANSKEVFNRYFSCDVMCKEYGEIYRCGKTSSFKGNN